MNTTIKLKELKQIISKISMGLEKSNVNPSASWIELESNDDIIVIKIAN